MKIDKVILASASPRRRELLCMLTKEFEIIPAKGEEHTTKTEPAEVVMELSAGKACEVAGLLKIREDSKPESILVIGSDTIVALGSEIMGKPVDEEDACRMIRDFEGGVHQVYTGVTLIVIDLKNGNTIEKTFAEKTDVFVADMEESEIRAYVAKGESLDKAGAYGIQGAFGPYVDRIEGDYNNVVGFPVARIRKELKEMDIEL